MVGGLGFEIGGSGFGFWVQGQIWEFMVYGLGFGVWGSWLGVLDAFVPSCVSPSRLDFSCKPESS